MKYTKFIGFALAFVFLSSQTATAQSVQTKEDSVSYAVGVLFAKNIKQQGFQKINSEVVAQAIQDYMSGNVSVMPQEKCEEMYMTYMKNIQEKKSAGAKAGGLEYLAENMKKPGVTVTESGLQYEVIKSGVGGIKPGPTDKVKTHYHGMNIDGSVFDSSVDRGEPISFPVNGVIKGWTEALQLMSVGDKWRLVIPSELAYGARGAGAKIAPHATLIFEVELLGIE